MKQIITSSIAALAVSAAVAHAGLLVNANFDDGYSLGSLNGQSGTSDIGLGGSWNTGSLGSNSQIVSASGANNLTYTVQGGGTISSGSHVLQVSSPGAGVTNLFNRTLSTPVSGQDVYLRLVLSPVSISNTGSTFFDFYLSSTNDPFGNFRGNGVGQFGPDGAGAGIGNSTLGAETARATFGTLENGNVYLLVASLNWNETTSRYDSVSFWLNPGAMDGSTPHSTASLTSGLGAASLSTIGLSVANLTAAAVYNLDSVAVGTSWNDVVPVPEASTWAMGAAVFAVASLHLLRRRIVKR